MGYTTDHRGRIPNVFVSGTGQFPNLTCIRTNQSGEGIIYWAVLKERIRRQRRNNNHWAAAIITNCILTSK